MDLDFDFDLSFSIPNINDNMVIQKKPHLFFVYRKLLFNVFSLLLFDFQGGLFRKMVLLAMKKITIFVQFHAAIVIISV